MKNKAIIYIVVIIILFMSLSFEAIRFPVIMSFVNFACQLNDGRLKTKLTDFISKNADDLFMKPLFIMMFDNQSKNEEQFTYINDIYIMHIVQPSSTFVNSLMENSKDKNYKVRFYSIYFLGDVIGTMNQDKSGIFETLLYAAQNDPSPMVRNKAIVGLGSLQDNRAVDFLANCSLKEKDLNLRLAAMSSLAYIATRECLQPLIECLSDKNEEVVFIALCTLENVAEPDDVKDIEPLLKHRSKRIREQAKKTINYIKTEPYIIQNSRKIIHIRPEELKNSAPQQ